jgi:F0F1-type ATP synthase gamma subunit
MNTQTTANQSFAFTNKEGNQITVTQNSNTLLIQGDSGQQFTASEPVFNCIKKWDKAKQRKVWNTIYNALNETAQAADEANFDGAWLIHDYAVKALTNRLVVM